MKRSPLNVKGEIDDDSENRDDDEGRGALEKSDLFTFKLKKKPDKQDNQRHLHLEEFNPVKSTTNQNPQVLINTLSKPSLNPHHNPHDVPSLNGDIHIGKRGRLGTCYTGGEGKNEIKNRHEVQKENTEVTKGVKQKIEAFERLNEGQRLLLEKKKSTPGSEKLKTKTRRGVKGGGSKYPPKGEK